MAGEAAWRRGQRVRQAVVGWCNGWCRRLLAPVLVVGSTWPPHHSCLGASCASPGAPGAAATPGGLAQPTLTAGEMMVVVCVCCRLLLLTGCKNVCVCLVILASVAVSAVLGEPVLDVSSESRLPE